MSVNLTIIIPVYNSQEYLVDCLNSVCKQVKKNVEVIIVDDFSIDNSIKISKKFSRRFKFIKLVKHKRNKGVAQCRNLGINLAKGEYIQFLDSDDKLINGSIKIILKYLNQFNKNDVFFLKNLILNNAAKKSNPVPDNKQIFKFKKNSSVMSCTKNLNKFRATSWNFIIKKEFLFKNKIFFRKIKSAEDWMFVSEILCLLKKFYLMKKPIYIHRAYHFNTLGKLRGYFRAKSVLNVISVILKFIKDKKLFLNKQKVEYLLRIINLAIQELSLNLIICNKKDLKNLSLLVFKLKNRLSVLSKYRIKYFNFLSNDKKKLYDCLIQINEKKYKLINNYLHKANSKSIILFCAGQYGRIVLEYFIKMNVKIKIIADNNPAYENEKIHGLKIKNTSYLKRNLKKFFKFTIFVCNNDVFDFKKIRIQLIKIGYSKSNITHFNLF